MVSGSRAGILGPAREPIIPETNQRRGLNAQPSRSIQPWVYNLGMPEPSVTYIWPAWGMVPQVKHGKHAVHATVKFDEDSTLGADVVHNFNLPYGGELQPPEWIYPIVLVNPVAGGINAPYYVLGIKDGNTISLGRVAGGPGTNVTFDVWIFRPRGDGLFAGW